MTCSCNDKERHEWFPMKVMDFLQSDTVDQCEPWERQVYLDMLVLSFAGPGLIANPKRLARKLGLTLEKFEELMAGPVGEKWFKCCGRLWNQNLEAEREVASERRSQARGAGLKSAEARRKRAAKATPVERPLDDRSTSVEPGLDERSTPVERELNTDRQTNKQTNQPARAREGAASPPDEPAGRSGWPGNPEPHLVEAAHTAMLGPLQEFASTKQFVSRAKPRDLQRALIQAVVQCHPAPPSAETLIHQFVGSDSMRDRIRGQVKAWLAQLDADAAKAKSLPSFLAKALRYGPRPQRWQMPGFGQAPAERAGGAA